MEGNKNRLTLFSKILDNIGNRINFFNKDLGDMKKSIKDLFEDCSCIRRGIIGIKKCKRKKKKND